MNSFTFKDIHTKFCEKIDKLQNYNKFTVNLNLKELALDDCTLFIEDIKKVKYEAIENNNVFVADQLFHMQCVLNSLASSFKIWILIDKKEFKNAWDSLISAQDYLNIAKKINKYEGLNNLEEHLNSIENSLFPKRKYYLSAAFTSTIGKCSICQEDFDDCIHIENNVYCGQLCYRTNIEHITGNHVALVENPKDRRCIVTSYGRENSIIDAFTLQEIELKHESQEGIFHAHILSFIKLDWD